MKSKSLLCIMIAIICMFICDKVKAEELTLICDYSFADNKGDLALNQSISASITTTEYKNMTIRLIYEKGTYKLGFYDKKNNIFHDSNVRDSAKKFHNYGLYINHLSVYDIKDQYSFEKTKKCPAALYSILMTEGEENNPSLYRSKIQQYFGNSIPDVSSWSGEQYAMYLSVGENSFPLNILSEQGDSCGKKNNTAAQNSNYCPSFTLSETSGDKVDNVQTNTDKDNNGNEYQYTGIKCEYSDLSLNEDYKDLNVYIRFSFDNSYIYNLNHTLEYKKFNNVAYEFKASELNGKCPEVIYTYAIENISGQSGTHYFYLNKDPEREMYAFGLIETIERGEYNDDINSNLCNSGIMNYISKAYDILRFLIPVLIIVLSTIDFAGVILSGKDDTMEKAKKNFIIRIIVGLIILFVPFLLEVILNLSGILESKETLADAVCNIIK